MECVRITIEVLRRGKLYSSAKDIEQSIRLEAIPNQYLNLIQQIYMLFSITLIYGHII